MNHIDEALSAYLSNELAEGERREIEKHLGVCEQCNIKLQQLRKLDLLLNQSRGLQPPKDFVEKIMARVDHEKKIIAFSKRKTLMILAFAAAIAFFVLILALRNPTRTPIETNRVEPPLPVAKKQPEPSADAELIAHLDELQNMDLIRHLDDLNELDMAMLVEQTETTK